MSDIKKVALTIENFVVEPTGSGEFSMYKRVRVSNTSGETQYFKTLFVPNHVRKAISKGKTGTFYIADLHKGKVFCVLAYEDAAGSRFDIDELKDIAKALRMTGMYFFGAGTLASFLGIIAYGIGLILFPFVLYFGWLSLVKMPGKLKAERVLSGLKSLGFQTSRSKTTPAPAGA
ncbi:hypothetical protein [Pseudomonas fluorescens]|uniref:Uncharacterized protein n=1 Tax=Pseudomonas fluorescens TaxID=294 RepID=A0A0F4VFF7_PSEFL|nr:hypothetical protein [Pseudomonas fluorescens]KJZ67265.1 hypothetical protein VD17_03120 [Pseudomonas fluorescens]